MANIQKRVLSDGSVRYRVQVRMRGYPSQHATFRRLTDAKDWAKQTEAAIQEGRHFKGRESKKHTLGEAIDRYLEQVLPNKSPASEYSQRIQLDWWKDQLGKSLLSDITPPKIAEMRDKLATEKTKRDNKRSPATVRRYLAALSHCLTVAMKDWGWLDDNPMRFVTKPKEPRGRVRFLSDAERDRLLAECKKSRTKALYPVVVLALSTGMRRSEILNLKWSDVDFERRAIVLHETKNEDRRRVPLVARAHEELTQLFENKNGITELVFPAAPRLGRESHPIDIQSAWVRALKRAEISDFRFHDLRHTAASYLAMNGATPSEIAAVLGHRTLQMVKRYAHISDAHTSTIVERMNESIFETKKPSESTES